MASWARVTGHGQRHRFAGLLYMYHETLDSAANRAAADTVECDCPHSGVVFPKLRELHVFLAGPATDAVGAEVVDLLHRCGRDGWYGRGGSSR
jgi:hypothetical protein